MTRNPTRRWRQLSADKWQTLLGQFDASGLSVSAFCQREAISESSFYRWRARSFPAPPRRNPTRSSQVHQRSSTSGR